MLTLRPQSSASVMLSLTIQHQSFVYKLNDQTVLFLTIQFSISHLFTHSSIWPIHRTLSDATTLSQSRPGSNGIEEVLHIPQSSSITEASPSDCLASYPEQSWKESNPLPAEMQWVYSAALFDLTRYFAGYGHIHIYKYKNFSVCDTHRKNPMLHKKQQFCFNI